MSTNHLQLPRSSQWPALRDQWIRDHPTCAACGSKKNLEVHHKVPVHVARNMELDANNLITLCQDQKAENGKLGTNQCHFLLGHLGNWFNWNRNIDQQAHITLMKAYPRPLNVEKKAPLEPVFEPAKATTANPAAAPLPTTNEPQPAHNYARSRRT